LKSPTCARLQTHRGPADGARVSFALERGETLGLIGESGCGKSLTAMALMGLLPSAEVSGSIRLTGRNWWAPATRDVPAARQPHRHGVSGAHDGAQPVHTIGRQVAGCGRTWPDKPPHGSGRLRCWTAWAFPGSAAL
jgi:peptide/nickel transport system ATP-binding protein